MVGCTGIEPVTPCVSSKCSTPELTTLINRDNSFATIEKTIIDYFSDSNARDSIFNDYFSLCQNLFNSIIVDTGIDNKINHRANNTTH